jgi:hypothetical protein
MGVKYGLRLIEIMLLQCNSFMSWHSFLKAFTHLTLDSKIQACTHFEKQLCPDTGIRPVPNDAGRVLSKLRLVEEWLRGRRITSGLRVSRWDDLA